jgi:selenocysteine-specific elongation factor
MIVGTAGHIDHGKTTLVRALTGVDTDRLKEEKARGISIELGYAYTPLSNGDVLGFVDVPGHERLVHTMAAGACGIDFALLVIAADDGVMPQTREHVSVLELFGVTRGAVALTKVDRVDEARTRTVEAEVQAFLAGTVFRDAPLFRVNASAEADAGVRALKEHLEGAALELGLARRWAGDAQGPAAREAVAAHGMAGAHGTADQVGQPGGRLFRLAVDRVFTLAGHGTIVAGTVFSGSVSIDDKVSLFPSGTSVRVRSIHSQNRPAEVGRAGERCALTLAGIEKSAVKRGDWLADPRVFSPTTRVDVRLDLLTADSDDGYADRSPGRDDAGSALKTWASVHFHHGAADVTAHIVPLGAVTNGRSQYAQIVFDAPICAIPGDRFIMRDAQALHTLGGGIVLDPYAPARKRRSPERMRYLHALECMNAGDGVGPLLAEAPYGLKQSDLIRLTAQLPVSLPEGAITIEGAREHHVILTTAWNALRERAVNALRKFHADSPDEPGPDVGRLRRIAAPQLADDLWRALIEEVTSQRIILRSGPWLYLPGHTVTLSTAEEALAGKLQPLVAAGHFNPPWVRNLANTLNEPEDSVRQVLRKQVTRGAVFQVVHDLFYDRQCVDELATIVVRLAQEHGTVEAAQYRDAISLGRKRTIQILEFFDRVGLTRRVRDSHVLRSDSGWRGAR